jgi:hypothetical protein
MTRSKFDLEAVVQHHDSQLEAFGNRMGVVEKTLTAHSSVLQEIKDAVVKQGAKPTFDPRSTISIIKDIGIVFAMVCAGILYLAAQNGATDIALMKDKLERQSTQVERMESLVLPQSWAAVTKR